MGEGCEQIVAEVDQDDVTIPDHDVTESDGVTSGDAVTESNLLYTSTGPRNGNSISHDFEMQMEEVGNRFRNILSCHTHNYLV